MQILATSSLCGTRVQVLYDTNSCAIDVRWQPIEGIYRYLQYHETPASCRAGASPYRNSKALGRYGGMVKLRYCRSPWPDLIKGQNFLLVEKTCSSTGTVLALAIPHLRHQYRYPYKSQHQPKISLV